MIYLLLFAYFCPFSSCDCIVSIFYKAIFGIDYDFNRQEGQAVGVEIGLRVVVFAAFVPVSYFKGEVRSI